MKVALIQTPLHWENIPANLKMFSEKMAEINEVVDLIVLPEMFSTGFSMKAEMLAEEMNGTAVLWMKKAASEKNCVICGSLMVKEDGKFFNRLIWVQPDGTIQIYDKRHLFSLSDEPNIFSPGKERLITTIGEWRICPQVCYDLRFPVWSRNTRTAYDLLIYVANWPERRNTAWKTLLQARAIENQAYVIGLNRIGNDGNEVYHSGDSMVIDPLGKILYHNEHKEEIYIATLEMEELKKTRAQLPFLNDADQFKFT